MFPFWEVAIAPVLAAARARRLVEIGALKGEHTQLIIDHLGPDTELHVIDPLPAFDPAEHEARFAGQYVFHRALSLDVLGDLPPMDAALVDGDHNWYTVRNELRLLADAARRGDAPLPVLILHDVGWPYGRRDLYYDPDTIPAEHRQPWRRAGMLPGRSDLVERGGLNAALCNAEHEGGPRNGVMTALEDFVADHDRPLRTVVLPIYFGLAIAVEDDRLAAQPELAAVLDRLESTEGRADLLALAEEVRLRGAVGQHRVMAERDGARAGAARVTERHLRLLKAALLNEHHLEDEARFAHLTRRIGEARPPVAATLRDPVRNDQDAFRALEHQRLGPAGGDEAAESFLPHTAMGRARLDHLERALDRLRVDRVPGDLVECGTGRGGGAIFMRGWLDVHGVEGRRVWVADRFRSTPDRDLAPELPVEGVAGFRADLNIVREGFARFDLLDDSVRFLQGALDASLTDADLERVALLRIGRGTAGDDVRAALEHLYDRLAVGGVVILDDRRDSVARKELDAFRSRRGITTPMEEVATSTVTWRKEREDPAPPRPRRRDQLGLRRLRRGGSTTPAPAATEPVGILPRAPLAPPAPADAVDLTVVVVFYNMRREAERTLRSLSRAYQQDLTDTSYEVIVVDNGSAPDQRLDPATVAAAGPEFRLLDMGDEAEPSPVLALNRGIRAGRGRAYALMIDGAHVLTPGVLHFGLAGLATYAPAIVATQQWYVGPGQQGDAMDDGYDQDYEDRLFEAIEWPTAGYRLFEIGHFIGERDWLDGVWESNCLFVGRELLEQCGCFDESFSMAGGGYANLDLYERLGATPDVNVVTILGEGSFHQIHGGTTTNQPDPAERRARVFGYGHHYAELRGRGFKGPGKPLHYVGRISTPAARRTKPRRLSATAFAAGAAADGVDGLPTSPTPVADDLRAAFTESVWRSLPWTRTSWLDLPVQSAPTDLLAYQELISRVRPDHIIATGTADPGRTLFLASVCDLVGHGRVVSVGDRPPDRFPDHPRVTPIVGRPREPGTVAAVRAEVPEGARVLVVLGTRTDQYSTVKEFEAYAPLVPVGSYVVVTDTVVNGHPVWTGFGHGPFEAVRQILGRFGEFVPDPAMEKYSLTFNPGGFLLRTR